MSNRIMRFCNFLNEGKDEYVGDIKTIQDVENFVIKLAKSGKM